MAEQLVIEVSGSDAPVLDRLGYLKLREARAGSGLHHLCDRCGQCEMAGSYCSTDRTAAYTLIVHSTSWQRPAALSRASRWLRHR